MPWLGILLLPMWLLGALDVHAQSPETVTAAVGDSIATPQKGVSTALSTLKGPQKYVQNIVVAPKLQFFQGFSVGFDVVGPIMYVVGDYGMAEGVIKLNLQNKYFPTVEAGYAKGDMTDANTNIHYSTSAPFFRAGLDINLLRNKLQDNRLFVGIRYGFSSYTFDMSGPDQTDPVWGSSGAFQLNDQSTQSHWAEIVVGAQVKIYRNFHMNWMLRYKRELSTANADEISPYYIPGYGSTTGSSVWGVTYSLIFDVNWGKKKAKTL
jgi:hypothetical protein